MKNIIFGVFMSDCDLYSTNFDIVFAYQDKWEETHSIENSVITTDNKEFHILLKNFGENSDLLDDLTEIDNLIIPILGNVYDEHTEEPPEELITAGTKLGCIYNPNFGKVFQERYWKNY